MDRQGGWQGGRQGGWQGGWQGQCIYYIDTCAFHKPYGIQTHNKRDTSEDTQNRLQREV